MALKGMEDITHELTAFEIEKLVPMLCEVLTNHRGKTNSVTNARLRDLIARRFDKNIAEPRVRKITEYIRQAHLVECLIAGRFGYFIATTTEEMDDWLLTMKQRRNALTASIAAGERSKRRMTGYKQPNQFKRRKVDPSATQHFIFQ